MTNLKWSNQCDTKNGKDDSMNDSYVTLLA